MRRPLPRDERGASLVELMVALVVLTLGILAIGQVFPAGTRGQQKDHMTTTASYYAQEKIEQLQGLAWSDANLTLGPHPAASFDTLGTRGQWRRRYVVESLAAPLDNLRKITVTVSWRYLGDRSVNAVTYVRR